ncbi:MAG: TraR/DksA C4-type zinc finger protein [Planctomycetes bacterium]|nr:TraR/DksA C4-type zinc finger protein [Planctomycetota bacterium]
MSKGSLTLQELSLYRLQLQSLIDPLKEKVSELEAEALRPVAALANHPDRAPTHDADPETRDTEDRVALAILNTEEHVLAEVGDAIARLDAGTFGKCEKCGHAITRARLDVVPYARHCIRCARSAEATV